MKTSILVRLSVYPQGRGNYDRQPVNLVREAFEKFGMRVSPEELTNGCESPVNEYPCLILIEDNDAKGKVVLVEDESTRVVFEGELENNPMKEFTKYHEHYSFHSRPLNLLERSGIDNLLSQGLVS